MQSVQPTSQDSRHYHTDESAQSVESCCSFTKLHTHPSTSLLLSASLFCHLSCIFLNGCLYCFLSFLPYLHVAAFHRAKVAGRHSLSLTHYYGAAPPAMPTAISLSGLCWEIRPWPGCSQSPELCSQERWQRWDSVMVVAQGHGLKITTLVGTDSPVARRRFCRLFWLSLCGLYLCHIPLTGPV